MKLGLTVPCEVDEFSPHGLYLITPDEERILLPGKEIPADARRGQVIDAFLYLDSEDRPIATLAKPLAQVGDIAALDVVEVNQVGAFLNWGLPKDLLLPFRNQTQKVEAGKTVVVTVLQDPASGRLVATQRIKHLLSLEPRGLSSGMPVEIMVFGWTQTTFDCIVDEKFLGSLLRREVEGFLHPGTAGRVFVRRIREDGRIDLSLKREGYKAIAESVDPVMQALVAGNGFLDLTDDSDPELIRDRLGISKKLFKKAVGGLLKQGLVQLERDGIRLVRR